jgi:hypothetical protein
MIYRAMLLVCFFALFLETNAHCQNTEIVLEKAMISQTLSGHVQFENELIHVKGVLVEVCDAEWKNQIASTTTDSDGAFFFRAFKAHKTYYLRLSLRNANTLLVKVKLKSSGPKELILNMTYAT